MSSQLTVSVVIPVYRAEQTLVDLYRQLSDAMSKLTPVWACRVARVPGSQRRPFQLTTIAVTRTLGAAGLRSGPGEVIWALR
jgi:hypothetical protein